jgi:hypothetical protein
MWIDFFLVEGPLFLNKCALINLKITKDFNVNTLKRKKGNKVYEIIVDICNVIFKILVIFGS